MTKWHEYIKIEDLPEDYQLMAGSIGLENVIKLTNDLPKVYIYLKGADKLFLPAKRQYILDAFAQAGPDNKFRPRKVALETGLSVDYVYKLLNESSGPKPKQDEFNFD
ncbi:hypothetical protein KI809_15620 [Geobacter pelophilus]|uniref:Mor transcription activator family protein n=1 Tax=Geoanaerobacter pelophilus TaxID=60036 RepID=A0AAW4L9K3_9BACT|nr:hypothetical protein [Geoanaerobacter pelophilus]MBT0664754.1 hypothetical protein [Geoanaerobacter pelophilus]MBT0665738.1 hypothetical protein [Geoanaerobacter pelophilus]